MENKNVQKQYKSIITHHKQAKSSEAGGVKTIPNLPERLSLEKVLCSPLPSGSSGEQLKSKAMCTKSISKPRSMWQHTYDAFGLMLGPLMLFLGSARRVFTSLSTLREL